MAPSADDTGPFRLRPSSVRSNSSAGLFAGVMSTMLTFGYLWFFAPIFPLNSLWDNDGFSADDRILRGCLRGLFWRLHLRRAVRYFVLAIGSNTPHRRGFLLRLRGWRQAFPSGNLVVRCRGGLLRTRVSELTVTDTVVSLAIRAGGHEWSGVKMLIGTGSRLELSPSCRASSPHTNHGFASFQSTPLGRTS